MGMKSSKRSKPSDPKRQTADASSDKTKSSDSYNTANKKIKYKVTKIRAKDIYDTNDSSIFSSAESEESSSSEAFTSAPVKTLFKRKKRERTPPSSRKSSHEESSSEEEEETSTTTTDSAKDLKLMK